ncbi:MAG: hypothetical protein PWP23_2220 [Candidatus Sumerlaeota bacterium]|nr:hypothetical protein [Candidatus Sumerlaeota bacterium]
MDSDLASGLTHLPFERIFLFAALYLLLLLILGLARLAVFVGLRERFKEAPRSDLRRAFLIGTRMDIVAASLLLAPLIFVFFLLPPGAFDIDVLHNAALAYLAVMFFALYLAAGGEYFYFEEYGAKFNHIFLEYARPSREVLGMIWKDYPVVPTFLGVGTLTGGTLLAIDPLLDAAAREEMSYLATLACFPVFLAAAFFGIRGLKGRPIGINAYEFTNSQLVNQLAANGIFQVIRIVYDERRHGGKVGKIFGKAPGDAAARVRERVATPGVEFVSGGVNPLDRVVTTPAALRRPNVVIVLMESHAASYIGALGSTKGVTPYFDALAKEGLLFTRMYANGDRTARGIEAVLSSFPPLPGMSTLKRAGAHGRMFTVASGLKREGYQTRFYYGGDAAYDNVRGFVLSCGFDSVCEQRDIANPSFQTSWGVCDEDLYDRLLADLAAQPADAASLSFFLTISNHRPYTWPEGKIDPVHPTEKLASTFQYADYAMGQFIEKARKTAAWENTVFVFVADHGMCIHGQSLVPVERFHIPCLILAPGIEAVAGRRVETLCSQTDVLPTLLGLLGGERRHCSFGRDLLHLPAERGSALMHYYGSYAFVRDGKVLILAPEHRPRTFAYLGDVPSGGVGKTELPTDPDMLAEALSVLAMGESLYRAGTYRYES